MLSSLSISLDAKINSLILAQGFKTCGKALVWKEVIPERGKQLSQMRSWIEAFMSHPGTQRVWEEDQVREDHGPRLWRNMTKKDEWKERPGKNIPTGKGAGGRNWYMGSVVHWNRGPFTKKNSNEMDLWVNRLKPLVKWEMRGVYKIQNMGDFPGGPVAEALCFQCRGPGFDPWSGN